MSEDKKEVTQKIVDTFTNIDDLREYSASQYKVIISQSKKISDEDLDEEEEGLNRQNLSNLKGYIPQSILEFILEKI